MKRIKTFITAAIVMFSITGCINTKHNEDLIDKEDNLGIESLGIKEQELNFSCERLSFDDHYSNFSKITSFKNKFYLDAEYEYSNDDKSCYIYDTNTSDIVMFKGNHNKIIEAISNNGFYYTYERDDNNGTNYLCRYNTGVNVPDTEITVPSGRIGVYNNKLCFCDYEKFIVFNDDLSILNEINLGSRTANAEYILDSQDNVVIFSYDKEKDTYELKKIDKQSKLIFDTNDFYDFAASCSGNICGLWSTPQNIFVAVKENAPSSEVIYINAIDAKNGKTTNRYEVNGFQVIGSDTDKSFILKNSEGICRYNIESAEYEVLFTDSGDGEENIRNSENWWFENGILKVSGDVFEGYSGDSDITLIINEHLDIVNTTERNSDLFSDNNEHLFKLTDYSLEKNNSEIKLYISSDGNEFADFSSFSLDDQSVIDYWIQDNNICIISAGDIDDYKLSCYNTEGVCVKEYDFPYYYIGYIKSDDSGKIVLSADDKVYLAVIDENELNIEPAETLKSSYRLLSVDNSYGLFYDPDNNSLISFNVVSQEASIITYLSDFMIQSVIGAVRISDNKYLISGIDDTGKNAIWKLSGENTDDVSSLRISGIDIPVYYRDLIGEFNSINPNKLIQIDDYSKYSDEFFEGYDQLNKDVISGNVPDMLITDGSFNLNEYIKKGLISDLSSFIDSSTTSTCFECAFDFTDSKLFQVYPFLNNPDVFIAKDNALSKYENTDLITYLEYVTDNDTESCDFEAWEYKLLSIYLSEYVDYENKKCSFDNEAFVHILKFLKNNYASEYEESEESISDNELEFTGLASVLIGGTINDVTPFCMNVNNNPTLISPSYGIVICETSAQKETAVEFVKFLLSEKAQSYVRERYEVFPTNKTELNKAITSLIPEHLTPSSEKMNAVNSLFDNKIITYKEGSYLYNMIAEEISLFCSGEETAEETAKKIQNKVSLYLLEL